MKVFELIEKDHKLQRELMNEIAKTEGDSEERRATFARFRDEYRAHALAEEQAFYSALMEDPAGTDKARHSVAEHKQALDLLESINDRDMSTGAWLQEFRKFHHDNEHHMEEEEADVFPQGKKVLSDKQLNAMAADFQQRKEEALQKT